MKIRENVSFKELTSLQIGGNVRFLISCSNADEILSAFVFAKSRNLPFFILGGGSNLIPEDGTSQSVAIQPKILGRQIIEANSNYKTFQIGAGEDWDSFVKASVEQECHGIECLSGIPGWTGATPIQNVGAYGQEVSQVIQSVLAISTLGEQRILSPEQLQFGYRTSAFKSGTLSKLVVLKINFRLQISGNISINYPELEGMVEGSDQGQLNRKEQLIKIREKVLELREKKSMLTSSTDPNSLSVGSFFENPVLSDTEWITFLEKSLNVTPDLPPKFPIPSNQTKTSAAWLVEKAGFTKGTLYNGIGISTAHSLALVNKGGTVKDLMDFHDKIQHTVWEKFGIKLKREPRLLSECLERPGVL